MRRGKITYLRSGVVNVSGRFSLLLFYIFLWFRYFLKRVMRFGYVGDGSVVEHSVWNSTLLWGISIVNNILRSF